MAFFINISNESTFLSSITFFIILVPIPAIFIFDNFNLRLPFGIINPNNLSINDFLTLIFSLLRKTFNPQKVKNIVTGRFIVAAPFAIINDANTLSKSPLNTTIVLPSLTSDLFSITSRPFFI